MALFKIQKGQAKNLALNRPNATEGWCYFTVDDGKFYIDIAGDGSTTAQVGTNRIPLNAALADQLTTIIGEKRVNIGLPSQIEEDDSLVVSSQLESLKGLKADTYKDFISNVIYGGES